MKIMDKKVEKNIRETFQNLVTGFSEALGQMVEHQQKESKKLEKIKKMMGYQHLQKSGMASYDDGDKFFFAPDYPAKNVVVPFRSVGVAQLLSDGTFDFIRKPRLRAQSELIRKLAHGRVSKTKDGAIQLTLKVYQDEGVNISQTIANEALIATKAIVDWQLKR